MRHKTNAILVVMMLALGWSITSYAQQKPEQSEESPDKEHKNFVSTSAFMLFNALPNPPYFAQLNYGRRLTNKDVLIVEAITWRYSAPLGIPYGKDKTDSKNDFDGYARDIGVGLAYQRFWWRGLYSTIHATPFWQAYYDSQDKYIQSGFQLFMTLRAGYHFNFWHNRVFIEPSIAVTAWPINTNLPESFAKEEARWPSYFLAEPGLHVGVNF